MNDHEDMVAAIVAAFNASTADDRDSGRRWYPAAGAIIDGLAAWSGIPADRMAAVVAALSPRNPWAWNVADAAAFADAARRGDAVRPRATTFDSNADRAWAFANGQSDWATSAPKVRSFVANMTGDTDAVTVDVWAIRVATNGREHEVRSDRRYHEVANAYRTAAAIVGETPRELQAIVWVAAERTGLASKRRGRIGLTFKRGTLPIVLTLMAVAS